MIDMIDMELIGGLACLFATMMTMGFAMVQCMKDAIEGIDIGDDK